MESGCQGQLTVEFPKSNLRPGEYPLYFWLGDSLANPYDVVDDLVQPLTITTRKSYKELGFDPSMPCGHFNIESRVTNKS